MEKTDLFTCGGIHRHHGCKIAAEAVSKVAALLRAVGLGGIDAARSTSVAAAHSVIHVHLPYQLIQHRMTH